MNSNNAEGGICHVLTLSFVPRYNDPSVALRGVEILCLILRI